MIKGEGEMDLTFITNEEGKTLKDRFYELIRDSRFFDCLVGYFYVSGFHLIEEALEKAQKIRILVGIGTDHQTYELIKRARAELVDSESTEDDFDPSNISHAHIKKLTPVIVEDELSSSEDKKEIEEGINKFIQWIKEKKLEIRAYPSRNLHAKVYIMTFKEGDRDVGRVITGSSNLTQSGLEDNLEFNVELKNRADYEFAKSKFEELWNKAVDITDEYVQTIEEKTWLSQNITPYHLYLKFLYEYFKDDLETTDELFEKYLPVDFKHFEYQKQAVINAKKILEKYGGVFISDVVGLGKTYITALLASQLDGRTLVIAPPALIDKTNPGSWVNVFSDFRLHADFVSIGKLDDALEKTEQREYKNVIIDEAHRFRNDDTKSYDKLSRICRGKRIILVSATPYNNRPNDILSLIKLFQNPSRSNIPGVPNLEKFFNDLDDKLKTVDRQKEPNRYLELTREIAKEIREKVLKYIMIRRTRSEIEKYFAEDLRRNNTKFSEVNKPNPLFYQFNEKEDEIFMRTIELLTQNLTYARYMPLLYLKNSIDNFKEQSQRNMGTFMKVLLVKRLESSIYAFKKSLERFIDSYEKFIKAYENGKVYISKDYSNKIFELLEEDNDEEIQRLIEEGKVEEYESADFRENFGVDLRHDFNVLKEIKAMWESIERDPKLETLLKNLSENTILKDKKIIIFTESKETAEYLGENINKHFGKEKALVFHGSSSESIRDKIIENFDARARHQKDDYQILIATEVLAEGVNLHRANVVLNYDIPWNPTRLMQRVGRVNRIDTPHNEIHIFNFFPTKQADNEIELTNIARSKVEAFLTMLGGDSAILTEEEPVTSHELFDKLLSKKTLLEDENGEESELKYLKVIEEIRNKDEELFEKVKRLPKKARSAKCYSENLKNLALPRSLITFFRKGGLVKFFISDTKTNQARELDFLSTAKVLESKANEKRINLPLEDYYELLDKNKTAFFNSTIEEIVSSKNPRGKYGELLKIVKFTLSKARKLTDEQENYLRLVKERLETKDIPIKTVQRTLQKLKELGKDDLNNELKVIAVLQKEIPQRVLERHYAEEAIPTNGRREVILSLYIGGNENG